MLQGTENRKPWPFISATNFAAYPSAAQVTFLGSLESHYRSPKPLTGAGTRRGLTGLATNLLSCVFDAFAFVRFRRSKCTNLRCHGANQLTVSALQRQYNLALDFGRNSHWKLIDDRMRITQREIHLSRLSLGPIANAV